jgi:hypothetical protein
MTNFVNLKIKSVQSFRCDYRSNMCVHVFIDDKYSYIYNYLYLYYIFKQEKKKR